MIMITINFFKLYRKKHRKMNEFSSDIYKNFPGYERFAYPDYIERVTAGYGGEALLFFTEEKTALYDCGMAYCHDGLVKNIEEALKRRGRKEIDYILISHSHYDHIGALPYILKRWPDTIVCGAEKVKSVFKSEGARKTMKRLGEEARDNFHGINEPIVVDGFRIDRIVKDGDKIDMGDNHYFYVLETRGHTDCSLTYVFEPEKLMLASESTGVLRNPQLMHTAILKSYSDTIRSAEKCRAYKPELIIGPHYGLIPHEYCDRYFDLYIQAAEEEKEYILFWARQGLDHEAVLKKFEEKYWSEARGKAQPKAAFLENAGYTVSHIMNNFL